MKKIPMILLAMFTLSGCDRQEMIYSFNHVEEASVDNEVENTESVDNIQAETDQAVDITTEEPEISDVYSGPTVTLPWLGMFCFTLRWKKAVRQRMALMIFPVFLLM